MVPAIELFDEYHKAEALLAQGDVRSAAELCKHILEVNPSFAHGYHLMSSLFRNTGNLDKALNFSQLSIRIAPQVAVFYSQQGQLFFALGNWQGARESFEKASMLDEHNVMAYVLWADALVMLKEFEEAQKLFERARAMQDIPEIDEHEGIYLIARGDLAGAMKLFNRLIEKKPHYAGGHIHKGKLLFSDQRDREAQVCFVRALKLQPDSYEAQHYTALTYFRAADFEMAMYYALQASQANPPQIPNLLLLCKLLARKHDHAAVEHILRQVLYMKADHVDVLHGIINALVALKREDEALAHIDAVLAERPDHKTMRYFRAMVSGESPDAPPPEYITALFDGSSQEYEEYLSKMLGPHTATQLADALLRQPKLAGRNDLSLLDVGCGAGLAAEALRPITRTRIGVDVSEKMLGFARAKPLYDVQYALDMIEFMNGCDRTFDLVVASDVLPYVGNLRPFLHAARGVLGPHSLLAFSVEKEEGLANFRLNTTGRYTHSHDYITLLAHEEGYRMIDDEEIMLRAEYFQPAKGRVYILQKLQLH